jgi:putative endonuclease
VIQRNWRCGLGEVDLIVRSGAVLVFVEVKARFDDRFGSAASAVDERKQRRIRKIAVRFLAEHPEERGEVRFDVVAVTGVRVEVIEAAF